MEKFTMATMNPVLLELACCGKSKELDDLVNTEDAQVQEILDKLAGFSSSNGSMGTQRASDDLEESAGLQALSVSSLLEGVTVEGDTALHVVATCGDGEDFLTSARIIYEKARHLLFAQNKKGDTPVHCAVQAEKPRMVSRLIDLAKGDDNVKALLQMENKLNETALHEAVRIGNKDMVERLMNEHSELARFPKIGTSPLYVAILLQDEPIMDKLYEKSDKILSYSGPNGQNALHAAALRGPGLTGKLLKWKKILSSQTDKRGSTPLHFAAAKNYINTCSQLLTANPHALYQSDHHGLFPIHVAASVGATMIVTMFLKSCPKCASFRDTNGKTFLHVAVEKRKLGIVDYASRDISLRWILNMPDSEGNTALHLAVLGGNLQIFCALSANLQINLNLTNEKGETPLDLSRSTVPPGMYYGQNPEALIRRALRMVGARSGISRQDHFEKSYEDIHGGTSEYENKESDHVKETTQNLSIGSVLIATVTFGATFALPGGYKADDHNNGGTPTLAGRYALDAFIMANTLAFICSLIATLGFTYSGTPMVSLGNRQFHLRLSVYFITASLTSLTAAFALALYTVLAPVAYKTAVLIFVMIPLVLLWKAVDFWIRWALLARPFYTRKGLYWTFQVFTSLMVQSILFEFWPLIIIFCGAL